MKLKQPRRALALTLALIMCVPLWTAPVYPSASGAAMFTDVTDPATLEAVVFLSNLGIISPAERYNPNAGLDKAGYCKLVVDIAGVANIDAHRDYTIFSDVRAGHWALPYINAAVRELKIIGGLPDGSFGPNNPITYNEAATLLVRLLGYGEAELGYNWPRNYVNKAASLGLNKNVGAPASITRGQAAVLFYNLLFTRMKGENGKDGELYISRMAALSEPVSVIIEDVAGLSPDGSKRGLRTIGGEGFYETRVPLDASLVGFKGELLADRDGFVIRFTPSAQTHKEISFKSAAGGGVTGTDGVTLVVTPRTAVYDNGNLTTFAEVWQKMSAGDTVRVFFTGSGAIDYILWGHHDAGAAIVATTEKGGANAIYDAFGIHANMVTVVKNGAVAAAASITPYDTMSYVPGSGRVSVSSLRVASPYPGGAGVNAPESINLLGRSCPMSDTAMAQAANQFRVGDWVTACLSVDGVVGALYPTSTVGRNMIGWSTSNSSLVTLNGLEFSGSPSVGIFPSMLVSATGTGSGLSMSRVMFSPPSSPYDVKAGTVGRYGIAEWCRFFVISGDMVKQITRDEIRADIVPVSKIKHAQRDANNKIEVLVLEGVNNDALRYGYVTIPGDGAPDFSVPATFETRDGSFEIATGSKFLDTPFDGFLGISLDVRENKLYLGSVSPTYRYTVKYSDFDGLESVMADGSRVQIAGDCMLRREGYGYIDIDRLQQYKPDTLQVWCDTPAGEGGKIRLIMFS
ncbi:MAG: S-layer homology domain-containing protein [Oscillospiraceae bacterium]|nr:S-layer homology domain-containing protein [Oscillospiraceae bacterium]